MNRASILDQLLKNKKEITALEERLMMGNFSQENHNELLDEHKALMDERCIHMQALTTYTQGAPQENSVRFFLPECINLKSLANLEQECTLIAETMIQDLILRFERYEINQSMFDNAKAAIKYELECLNVTTIEEFKAQSKTAIRQAFALSFNQASCR